MPDCLKEQTLLTFRCRLTSASAASVCRAHGGSCGCGLVTEAELGAVLGVVMGAALGALLGPYGEP